jgi:hypothetical protein
MKTPLLSALATAVTLAAVACSPAMIQPESVTVTDSPASAASVEKLTWSAPLATSQPPDAYVASNMLVTNHVRMALPEGWRFKRRREEDPKGVSLWIHDTGGNAVSGAYSFNHFDFAISPLRATGVYADKLMGGYKEKEARRTEIDHSEAHVVKGVSRETGQQRISTLIFQGSSSIRAINDITLLADPSYLAQNPGLPHAIANSFKLMPGQMAERRIKGSFSFRCHDGTMDWLDDSTLKWQTAGFSVIGKAGDAAVVIDIGQVSTARFQDFFKLERFQPGEIATELHFAGRVFPARAVIGLPNEKKNVKVAFLFKHEGKDYLLGIFRKLQGDEDVDAANLHKDKGIRRVLDESFYYNG